MDTNRFNKFIPELKTSNDRTTGILAGAFLESLLELILRSFLTDKCPEDIWGANGALNTFSNKILMAYSLGLISENEHSYLIVIKNIRNHCAHSLGVVDGVPVDFSKPPLIDLCKEFLPTKWINKLDGQVKKETFEDRNGIIRADNARGLFDYVVVLTALALHCRINAFGKRTVPPMVNEEF